jgi:hypothetical protein
MALEILKLLAAILVIEATTELISESDLFAWLREKIGKPLACGYCLSFWAAMPFAICMTLPVFEARIPDVFASMFIYQRLANLLHEPINRFITRQPFILFNNSEIKEEDD